MMGQRIVSLMLACLALCTSSRAQCATGPDGLNGPCWSPAVANLPTFPALSLPGTGICWQQCQPQQQCLRIAIGAPQLQKCGQYKASFRAIDCNNQPTLSGSLLMDYTRTWGETTINPAASLQVYRFVVKVDLNLTGGAIVPCLTPSCLPTLQTAFYYGYVDYAFDCTTGTQEGTLVLFHNCDAFIHHPLSSTPGVFHPGMTYAMVAPSTAANPFVATIATPPGGPLIAEAVRNVPVAASLACITEDVLAGGFLQYVGSGCFCAPIPSPAPPQLSARRLAGKGSCVNAAGQSSSFASANTMPTFPWFHMMTTSIGTWTTGATYPGPETVWVDEVPIFYQDSCTQTPGATAHAYGEVYYGASTSKGYPVTPTPIGVLSDKFTDLASNTSWKVPGPVPPTFMGNVLPTRNLIYVNVP